MAPRSEQATGGRRRQTERVGDCPLADNNNANNAPLNSGYRDGSTTDDVGAPQPKAPLAILAPNRRLAARAGTAAAWGVRPTMRQGSSSGSSAPQLLSGLSDLSGQLQVSPGGQRNLALESQLGASVIGLVRTIEDEILPRLKQALDGVAGAPPQMMPTYEQVGELARLSVSREDSASLQYVEGLIQAGMSLETVYENLLVAAARRLGEFWNEDACDFSDVTVGMIRLQKIQRTLSRDMRQSKNASAATKVSKLALRRALIVPMPGEQHTIGATIVQDFFARAGWQVVAALPATDNELVQAVRHENYDMVGLTLSRDDKLQELAACIALVRCASRNKNVVIAVGGPPFVADPLRSDAVGADATGSTGAEAVAAVDAALSRALEPA